MVPPRQPAEPGDAPRVLALGLERGLAVGVRETVDVEHAVEMVVLVLEDPGEPAVGADRERLALQVDGLQDDALGAPQREALARERQSALRLGVLVRLAHRRRAEPQHGVDRDAAVQHVVVVRPAVDEQP